MLIPYDVLDKQYREAWEKAPAALKEQLRERNRAKLSKDWDKVLRLEETLQNGPHSEEFRVLEELDFDRRLAFDRKKEGKIVGQISFANGEQYEFINAAEFIGVVKGELDYQTTTGFRYKVVTTDPAIRKEADDLLYNLHGEENPHPLEYYQKPAEQRISDVLASAKQRATSQSGHADLTAERRESIHATER